MQTLARRAVQRTPKTPPHCPNPATNSIAPHANSTRSTARFSISAYRKVLPTRHSREGGNPVQCLLVTWIPAFAGKTEQRPVMRLNISLTTASPAGIPHPAAVLARAHFEDAAKWGCSRLPLARRGEGAGGRGGKLPCYGLPHRPCHVPQAQHHQHRPDQHPGQHL